MSSYASFDSKFSLQSTLSFHSSFCSTLCNLVSNFSSFPSFFLPSFNHILCRIWKGKNFLNDSFRDFKKHNSIERVEEKEKGKREGGRSKKKVQRENTRDRSGSFFRWIYFFRISIEMMNSFFHQIIFRLFSVTRHISLFHSFHWFLHPYSFSLLTHSLSSWLFPSILSSITCLLNQLLYFLPDFVEDDLFVVDFLPWILQLYIAAKKPSSFFTSFFHFVLFFPFLSFSFFFAG